MKRVVLGSDLIEGKLQVQDHVSARLGLVAIAPKMPGVDFPGEDPLLFELRKEPADLPGGTVLGEVESKGRLEVAERGAVVEMGVDAFKREDDK